MAVVPANKALFDQIALYLGSMDLDGLFKVDANGQPSGWLWDQIVSGIDNEAALQIALENTDQFKQRYGIIAEMRAQAVQGKAVHVPTVAEVREYEQRVTSLMRQAGLPSYMYDNWSDAHALMRNGLSAIEVEERLGQAWERVQNTDPKVRAAFKDFYGTLDGDAALAGVFLDPTRTLSALERQSRAAYTAGQGRKVGIELDKQVAERIADMPFTDAGIFDRVGQLNEMNKSGLMTESIGESGNDLTTEGVGVDAAFFNDGKALGELERRVIERQAARSAVPGGAARTQQGLIGVSSATR